MYQQATYDNIQMNKIKDPAEPSKVVKKRQNNGAGAKQRLSNEMASAGSKLTRRQISDSRTNLQANKVENSIK